jgi:hypothetical protein
LLTRPGFHPWEAQRLHLYHRGEITLAQAPHTDLLFKRIDVQALHGAQASTARGHEWLRKTQCAGGRERAILCQTVQGWDSQIINIIE